jgi:hypothetical protein
MYCTGQKALFIPSRVTRWVCEKNAQNVAQSIFLSKLYTPLFWKKLPKENNHPEGENSPNLVSGYPDTGRAPNRSI